MVINDKFGKLTVKNIFREFKSGQYRTMIECLCDCGKKTKVRMENLKNGVSKSCGCLQLEKVTKHGMSRTREWNTWEGMVKRCHSKKHIAYKRYGGRGILVCDKWRKFEGFFDDMGYAPKLKTLDRINNDKGYYKENCRWATRKEQQNNTRTNHFLEYKGKRMTVKQWSEETGIRYGTLLMRINKYKWSVKKSLNK